MFRTEAAWKRSFQTHKHKRFMKSRFGQDFKERVGGMGGAA